MALATHRLIENRGEFIREEKVAGAASIKPGMLLMVNAAGNAVIHNVAETQTPLMIGNLDALQGSITTTAYTSGASIPVCFPSKGSVVNVLVLSGEAIVIGSKLCSNGDGKFITVESATSGSLNAGVMLEATESQSAVLAADTLVACRVL